MELNTITTEKLCFFLLFCLCKKGHTVNKRLAIFLSLARMSQTKLSLAELVTSPDGDAGKSITFFYNVYSTYGSVVPVHPDPVVRQNLGGSVDVPYGEADSGHHTLPNARLCIPRVVERLL